MLYNLLYPLSHHYAFLNVFKYLTFRGMGAALTALFLSLWVGPVLIRHLRRLQGNGQPIRKDGPSSHLLTKSGTPTMGGLMILFSLGVSTLLWADLANPFVWIVLGIGFFLGGVGALDDYKKVSKQSPEGMFGRTKLLLQILGSGLATILIFSYLPAELRTHIAFPFLKNFLWDISYFFLPFGIFVITGSSNAVNLTDGLDGLATGPLIIVAGCFSIIAYSVGNAVFSHYLQIPWVPGSGELSVVCGALIGSALGFLWFNAPPAQIFMGDTGSLALGGILGAMSLITKHELVLAIVGGLFVVETFSVILQVAYFKMTGGKRIFLMAPLHHHFEKKGWPETKIVVRFWIISLVLGIVALSTLKLR